MTENSKEKKFGPGDIFVFPKKMIVYPVYDKKWDGKTSISRIIKENVSCIFVKMGKEDGKTRFYFTESNLLYVIPAKPNLLKMSESNKCEL